MQDSDLLEEAIKKRKYGLLQDAVRDLSKKEAVEHLHGFFPHKAKAWFTRNLPYLMALDPERMAEVLTYSDPTANKAIRNVMKEAA